MNKIAIFLITSTLILLSFIPFAANAQNATDTLWRGEGLANDSIKYSHSRLWQFVPPVTLVAIGVSSFVFKPVRNFDFFIKNEIKKNDPTFRTNAETYFLFTPIVMVYGLNLIGVEGKNNLTDRTAILGLSAAFFGVTVYGTKAATHSLRPSGSVFSSFPSGHTAAAFMVAEFLAQEYSDKSPIITIVGCSFAVTTGVFRLYNRDHVFSEVIAGAGYGMISTKLAYLIYPHVRNILTHKNKYGGNSMIMPTYQNGSPGFCFAMQL